MENVKILFSLMEIHKHFVLYLIYNYAGGSNLVQLQSSNDRANLVYFLYIAIPR